MPEDGRRALSPGRRRGSHRPGSCHCHWQSWWAYSGASRAGTWPSSSAARGGLFFARTRSETMATRGIWQLRRCQLFFSDRDGSSRGMRSALYSFEFRIRCSFARNNSACREFIKQSLIPVSAQNPQIEFEALLRRGRHPTIRAQYGAFRLFYALAPLRCNDPKSFRS